MKRKIYIVMLVFGIILFKVQAQNITIRVATDETELILKTAPDGRLYQCYLGEKLLSEEDVNKLAYYLTRSSHSVQMEKMGFEVYPASGWADFFESAFSIQHNDGNLTSILTYVSHTQKLVEANITETIIEMKDQLYPLNVKLHYITYLKENIIKSWIEISHMEKKPVKISRYNSSMLYFQNTKYFLTEFSGDWAREVQMSPQQLQFGKKILDTRLGTRAAMFAYPFFELGLDQPVSESQGKVLLGTIGWTGNFQFTFEVDNLGNLRIISGINSFASNYELQPNTIFRTPEFIFTLSNQGKGKASRNFHSWARNYQLNNGKSDRMTLLTNWETTFFDFDESKLNQLMKQTKELGLDLFLLDDGWFGNKYPRANDKAGLGDWVATKNKLPNGIPGLVKIAKETGVKFGLWIEPEMINPKSDLYEKHPDWVIQLPNRETYYYRNQLVLDLSNPKVQDYVFSVVDNLMRENPDISFFKWDCNSPITNVYSPYLKEKQEQLYIDYVLGVHGVFKRVKEKYPQVQFMLCSGGGARCDYEALKYFSEFWPSDNTDPIERIFIQWGFLQFLPAKSMANHVTHWNKNASIKFTTEVAMMGKLGFDVAIEKLKKDEIDFIKLAVTNFNRLKKIIFDGDLYRLISPYSGNHSALMYVDSVRSKAVLYVYDIFPRFNENLFNVKLQGLDPLKKYHIKEINLLKDKESSLKENNNIYSGDYLMKVGLATLTSEQMNSRIIEITAQ